MTETKLALSESKKKIAAAMDHISLKRDRYIRRNRYYYKDIIKFLKFNIPKGSSILEIGCGTGSLLNALNPGRGVGIDISTGMIQQARGKYKTNPNLEFLRMDAEHITLEETFDFVVISDTLGYFEDIQSRGSAFFPKFNANISVVNSAVPVCNRFAYSARSEPSMSPSPS